MTAKKTIKNSRRKTGENKTKTTRKVTPLPKKASGKKLKKKTAARKTVVKKPPVKAAKAKGTAKAVRRIRPSAAGKAKTEEERKALLRKTLVARREAIVQEAKSEISKYIKGETRQLVDTALDDGDWSVVDLSEDVSLRQLSVHKDTLRKIDEALMKLKEGTYGICEDCGEKIDEARLKILSFAIYCTECQERREKLEEIERSQGIGS